MIIWYTTACQLTLAYVSRHCAVRSRLGSALLLTWKVKVMFSLQLRIRPWEYIRAQKECSIYSRLWHYIEIGNQPHTSVILAAKEPLVLIS